MDEQRMARDNDPGARPAPPTSTASSTVAPQIRPPDDDEVQGYVMRPPSLNEATPEEELPAQT